MDSSAEIWVWENFREDYTTLALFAGIKTFTILIVSSQTLNFEMYYFYRFLAMDSSAEIWVWENFREDYTTLALFAGIKTFTILIVSSQTLNFEMYYFINWWIFFPECWSNGLLNCAPFTY